MTTEQMTSKQDTVDKIVKSLGAFVALAFIWVATDFTSQFVNPFGLFSLLAAILFVCTIGAMVYVIVSSGTLFLELD